MEKRRAHRRHRDEKTRVAIQDEIDDVKAPSHGDLGGVLIDFSNPARDQVECRRFGHLRPTHLTHERLNLLSTPGSGLRCDDLVVESGEVPFVLAYELLIEFVRTVSRHIDV